ncbi:MAG: hypothetical protein L3J39_01590 [Verrucomicrobiales bacterium]|nr:hypothetical protein [Verrucomicrobiales bacterium]
MRIVKFMLLGLCLLDGTLFAENEPSKSRQAESELDTRVYEVPSNFLDRFLSMNEEVVANDPFGDFEDKSKSTKPADRSFQGILNTHYGIPFPKGASAIFNPKQGRLEVRADLDTMELVEAFIGSWNDRLPKQLNVRVEIYQMPAIAALKVQQLCGAEDDHTFIWEKVLGMMERKQASLVVTSSVIAQIGQIAKAESVREVIYPTEVKWSEKAGLVLPVKFKTRKVGTILEVDPVLQSDYFTVMIDLKVEHHTGPPLMKKLMVNSAKAGRVAIVELPEFQAKTIATQITMRSDSYKCIGAWRPTGKPEYVKANAMQVVFLRVDLQTTGKIVPWKQR